LARLSVYSKAGFKTGYIDKTGRFVIRPQFDLAYSFSGGLARVEINGRVGYINKEGDFVWKPIK
jgi:hypothetical protein